MRAAAPHVVVVGGGFGGIYAATYLARSELAANGARITLVDRKNYFTFTPLLAEVAAGALGREDVTYPYRILTRRFGVNFVHDSIAGLDARKNKVFLNERELTFDYLVLATGAEPQYFGNRKLEQASMPFVSVGDALAIRSRVMHSLERAALVNDETEREKLLTFLVAGGGPAGVEIASEIQHLVTGVLPPYMGEVPPIKVILADGSDRILRGFDETLAREGLDHLGKRGIDVRLNTRIDDVENGVVTAVSPAGTDRIKTDTLIWTAGTAPGKFVSGLGLPTNRGAIEVDHFLRVVGSDNIFAIGDVSNLEDPRSAAPFPRVAPIAISQGVRAAANIESHAAGRELEPFHAFHAGKIVSLGCGTALVDILGFHLRGKPAWWTYRMAYLLKLVGTKNKIRVLMRFALNRLFEPDITYEEASDSALNHLARSRTTATA